MSHTSGGRCVNKIAHMNAKTMGVVAITRMVAVFGMIDKVALCLIVRPLFIFKVLGLFLPRRVDECWLIVIGSIIKVAADSNKRPRNFSLVDAPRHGLGIIHIEIKSRVALWDDANGGVRYEKTCSIISHYNIKRFKPKSDQTLTEELATCLAGVSYKIKLAFVCCLFACFLII